MDKEKCQQMNTLRILVVEDEYGMRLAIARALRDYTIHLPDIEGEIASWHERS
jgi:hypothetical protein